MSLSADFNNTHRPSKTSESVLMVYFDYHRHYYDFNTQVMTTVLTYGSAGAVHVTPFSQLDRGTLIDMREKLIELGGKPPELPPEAPSNPGVARKAGGLNP
jgi:hypothetical protein